MMLRATSPCLLIKASSQHQSVAPLLAVIWVRPYARCATPVMLTLDATSALSAEAAAKRSAPSHAKTPVADRSFQFQWFASTTRTLAAPRVLAHRGAPCSQSALRASSSGICGSCLSRRAKCWPKASLFTQRLRRHPSPTTDPDPNTGPNRSRADPGRRATAHPRKQFLLVLAKFLTSPIPRPIPPSPVLALFPCSVLTCTPR